MDAEFRCALCLCALYLCVCHRRLLHRYGHALNREIVREVLFVFGCLLHPYRMLVPQGIRQAIALGLEGIHLCLLSVGDRRILLQAILTWLCIGVAGTD